MQDVIVRYRAKISSVRDVLADKFVGVLNKAFLPGGIGVGKEDFADSDIFSSDTQKLCIFALW